jgi:hypothetical protein
LQVLELKIDHEYMMAGVLIPGPTIGGRQRLADLNSIVEAKELTPVEATTQVCPGITTQGNR